jgi:hypothetical protein
MKSTNANFSTNLWQRYAVVIVAFLIMALSPAYAEQLTAGVSFAQISFISSNPQENYSHYGQVSVDYTMIYGEGYINVERYNNGQAAGWIVRNLPVISGSVLPGFTTVFDLGVSGYQSSITAYVDFSPTKLADDTSLKGKVPLSFPLGQAEYPFSPSTFSASCACDPITQSLQAEDQAQPPAVSKEALTVAKVKNPDGGTATIFWFNPANPQAAPKHIKFTVKKMAKPEDAADAIAKAMNEFFKDKKLEYSAKAVGATVTLSGGWWAAVNNPLVSLTVD